MPFKVTVNMPSLAEDGEVYIPGLGTVKQGENYFSDELVAAYQQANIDHEPAYVTAEDGSPLEDENGNWQQVGMQQKLIPFDELISRYAGLSSEEVSEDELPVDPEVQAERDAEKAAAEKQAADNQRQQLLNLGSGNAPGNKDDDEKGDEN